MGVDFVFFSCYFPAIFFGKNGMKFLRCRFYMQNFSPTDIFSFLSVLFEGEILTEDRKTWNVVIFFHTDRTI